MDIVLQLALLLLVTQDCDGLAGICGDRTSYPVTWMDFPPYTFREEEIDPNLAAENQKIVGAIHEIAGNMVKYCCGTNAKLLMKTEVHRSTDIEDNLSGSLLAYPVTRRSQHTTLDNEIPEWTFLPIVELAGSYILLDLDHLDNVVFDALLGAWPLAVLVLSAAGVSGFIIWFLDRSGNEDEFPKSFLQGGWEGIWWAIVTATTVGYGDRAPRSIPARIFGLTWMLLGIILMSIFTATLVSAIQAEDKVGTDIKGTKIAVVSGSQEEHYAFSAGAIPQAFESFDDVLDSLEEKRVEAAIVDPFYALYFSEELDSRNIHTADIIHHNGVHGILLNNVTTQERRCFAKYMAVNKYKAFDFMVKKVGSLKSMRGKAAHHTSRKLVGSNMIIIYVFCTTFTALLLGCCIWEFVWYRPKARRALLKHRSKHISDESESMLLKRKDVHQF